jgi:N-acyl-D-amino-acid deacylase
MVNLKINSLFFALLLTATPVVLPAQAAAPTANALKPAPMPAPAPSRWKGLIGEYGTADNKAYVLEKDGSLYFRLHDAEERLAPENTNHFRLGTKEATFSRGTNGEATHLTIGGASYPRLPFSAVRGGVFRIEPLKPVAELTRLALADHPPAEQGEFRPVDLVEVAKLDPSIKLDIRYASANNFLSAPVYSEARAFLERPAAEAVVRANRRLKPLGYGLLIHDAYRPWYVTKVFWDATPDAMKNFVADPSKGSRHNRGCAVDITLYDLKTGKEIPMTGVYDEMSDRSYPNYPGGTSRQRWHRELLRQAMEDEGFAVYELEWWHFDYKDWQKYPILNATFDAIQPATSPAKVAGEALGEIAAAASDYDVIIKNGHIIDGSGNPWVSGDIGIRNDRIVTIGKLDDAHAKRTIDATGLVVSPGFIDMLGQSEMALLIDNRSLSKLSQGITTEITGEGGSIAPQTPALIAEVQPTLDRYHLKIDWTTLDGYFKRLERSDTPLNIGTYVGAAQVRKAVLGDDDRAPTSTELEQMKALVAEAMKDGAFGLSTALIYPPGHYAKTDELIELAKVASQYGGIYGTHMRSEGTSEIQALEEALRIGREAHIPLEVFHLKVIGSARWGTMPRIVGMIQAARDSGQDVTADMYPYVAGGTALASSLPPWAAEGGMAKLLERLHDPQIRQRIKSEMATEHPDWENLYLESGGAKGVIASGIINPDLKKYDGMTIARIAAAENKDPLDALIDFVIADQGQTGALYFIASEADLKYGLKQPWTSLCLDASESSLDGPLFEPHNHPRAFGAMPRFLGHYVRDEKLLPLEQAIRKMTSLPAQRLQLNGRGILRQGFFADITIFDPATIIDKATYASPAQISEGVKYVFVNGQLEYEDGRLTGIKAGKALRGPGWSR